MGKTRGPISAYEAGLRKPKLETILKFAEALEIDVEDLIYGNEQSAKQNHEKNMSDDVIYRQATIDKFEPWLKVKGYNEGELNMLKAVLYELKCLPSAQPELDEWCTDCKEYDQERHCCPRWNRVIRNTLKDAERKPGRWEIRETADGDVEAKCPCCGFETLVNQPGNGLHMVNDLHFCPTCGLPMERGEEDG